MDLSGHWKTIVNTLNESVLVVDLYGRIVALNKAAEKLTGYPSAEIVGRSCRILNCTGCNVIGKGSGVKWCGLFADGDVRSKSCNITNKSNRDVTVLKNASILRQADGQPIGAVETLKDMSDILIQHEQIHALRRTLSLDQGFHGILGKSRSMKNLFEMVENVAISDAPVMIHGESGTGKEMVARAIHDISPRRNKPYLKVNCAALNENLLESELFGHAKGAYTGADHARVGRFEAAHGGTIFLDEIGDISPATQVKLLRVLEEKEFERVGEHKPVKVDVRVVSATNRNLDELVQKGVFREDLLFRINVFPLQCPALRERTEDIPIIIESFLRQNAMKNGNKIINFSPEAMTKIMQYNWQGNVRELRNVVEYALVLCRSDVITVDQLPPKIIGGSVQGPVTAAGMLNDETQKNDLINALRQASGNQTEAGRILGISRIAVWRRIKKYGINLKKEIYI